MADNDRVSVAVIGHTGWDVVSTPTEATQRRLGGTPLYAARALRAVGVEPVVITKGAELPDAVRAAIALPPSSRCSSTRRKPPINSWPRSANRSRRPRARDMLPLLGRLRMGDPGRAGLDRLPARHDRGAVRGGAARLHRCSGTRPRPRPRPAATAAIPRRGRCGSGDAQAEPGRGDGRVRRSRARAAGTAQRARGGDHTRPRRSDGGHRRAVWSAAAPTARASTIPPGRAIRGWPCTCSSGPRHAAGRRRRAPPPPPSTTVRIGRAEAHMTDAEPGIVRGVPEPRSLWTTTSRSSLPRTTPSCGVFCVMRSRRPECMSWARPATAPRR